MKWGFESLTPHMTCEQHKEMFTMIEQQFWANETTMVIVMGVDPDKHAVAVTGPDATIDDYVLCMRETNKDMALRALLSELKKQS